MYYNARSAVYSNSNGRSAVYSNSNGRSAVYSNSNGRSALGLGMLCTLHLYMHMAWLGHICPSS